LISFHNLYHIRETFYGASLQPVLSGASHNVQAKIATSAYEIHIQYET